MDLTTKAILSRYPFYDQAPSSLQQEIFKAAEHVYVPAGHVLFATGNVCQQLVLLGQGCIRVFSQSNSGRQFTLYHVNPGETCPISIMCVLLGKLAPATAVVTSPLEAITLPALQFQNWVDNEPEVRLFAIESLGVRLADVILLVEEMVFNHLDIRLADFLCSRFGAGEEKHPVLSLSDNEIAQQLGSTSHVIRRVLQDFASNGAIKLGQGQITLQKASLLREINSK